MPVFRTSSKVAEKRKSLKGREGECVRAIVSSQSYCGILDQASRIPAHANTLCAGNVKFRLKAVLRFSKSEMGSSCTIINKYNFHT